MCRVCRAALQKVRKGQFVPDDWLHGVSADFGCLPAQATGCLPILSSGSITRALGVMRLLSLLRVLGVLGLLCALGGRQLLEVACPDCFAVLFFALACEHQRLFRCGCPGLFAS